MDEVDYVIWVESTDERTPVVGFKRACDEAYCQALNSPYSYDVVKVLENGDTVHTVTKDGYYISQD